MATEEPKLARENTMQATAKEGIEFLEKADPKLADQCKTVAKEVSENGAGDAPAAANGDEKPKLARDNTMVTTAQEGKEFLEKQGGVNEDAKTRSQDAEQDKSATEENGDSEEKVAAKRPAEDAKPDEEEAKKQKTEEPEESKNEEAAAEEQKAE